MTTHINIVHKLYDRKGGVSGYMMKNGHGAPDEYRVYDAKGNFLYGIVSHEPWTVFRILDHDGRLVYVACARTKNLRKRLELLKIQAQYLSPSLLGAILGEEEYPTRRGMLITREYPTRQQAEDVEKRYVRQMGFAKHGLSTPGRQRPRVRAEPERGEAAVLRFVQKRASQEYINRQRASTTGKYRRFRVSGKEYANAA